MKVTLYLPYYDYNDGAFDVSDDYYGKDEYIEAITNEYNRNKDIIYNSVMDARNGSGTLLQGIDGQTYKFGSLTSQKDDKVAYSSCETVLYNGDGNDETVDNIITHFAKQESFIELMEFDFNTSEEEFESELALWKNEHNKINDYKVNMGDEWAWLNEPKRNVKMHFKNNADEDLYSVLENCKIMNILEDGTLILFIEKIRLIDKI